MAGKRYEDFVREGYPLPRLSWLLNKGSLYWMATVVALLAVGGLILSTYTSVAAMKAPLEDKSPHQALDPRETPATSWAQSFLQEAPPGAGDWQVSGSKVPQQPVDFKTCSTFGLLSPTVQSSHRASDGSLTVQVNIYNAGTTPQDFLNYKDYFTSCWSPSQEVKGNPATTVLRWEGGFAFTRGDAIIFVQGGDPALLEDHYLARSASTLEAASCLDLTPTTRDRGRNLYLGSEGYTGWVQEEVVATTLNLGHIPTGIYPPLTSVKSMKQPEGPLPEGFPLLPEHEVRPPTLPKASQEATPVFQQVVPYQVPDDPGPGCGWAWHTMKAPVVDAEALKKKHEDDRLLAQGAVDAEAGAWVAQRLQASREALGLMVAAEEWNAYGETVRQVHEKWQWLNGERSKLEGPWRTYVEDHNRWVSFESRQAKAREEHAQATLTCQATQETYLKWEETWGDLWREQEEARLRPTPSATPSPTPNPEVTPTPGETPSPTPTPRATPSPTPTVTAPAPPESCTQLPAAPSILQQERGPEPQAPSIPQGVTLPGSWPKPSSSSSPTGE